MPDLSVDDPRGVGGRGGSEIWPGMRLPEKNLPCLVVRQPAPSLMGVAMAEGICVD